MKTAKKIDIQPVILCGGSGTRLWPLSRAGFPKQFLVLAGNESLFQQAVQRLAGLAADDLALAALLIVGNEEHRFLMLDQLREIKPERSALLLEPIGRNTAPALTLAALAALDTGNDPVLVVTPADQTVTDQRSFTCALGHAAREAVSGAIILLGIPPDRPETGYGYVRVLSTEDLILSKTAALATEPSAPSSQNSVVRTPHPTLIVDCFVEKPDAATAQRYLTEGGYYWNAGMFVLKASVWLAAIERFRPDIAQATRAAWQTRSVDPQSSALGSQSCFIRPGKAEFAAIPAESIDYAVMEPLTLPSPSGSGGGGEGEHNPTFPIKMVPLAAGWSDLGAWDAVWQVSTKDKAGNAYVGDILATDTRNTLVHATSRLVSLVGVDNLVVIETSDAVLIADRARSQNVKAIVAQLHASGREEHTLHRKVHRPWGWYDSTDDGPRFKVKRIHVKPKASLSLQKHHHRAEHWIVVKGTAEVRCGEKTILVTENQSTYIPLGQVHRLSNPGTIPLEIIEVQSGSYLGEDDIVRYEDYYGRTE